MKRVQGYSNLVSNSVHISFLLESFRPHSCFLFRRYTIIHFQQEVFPSFLFFLLLSFPCPFLYCFVCLFSIKKNNLWPTGWRPLDTFSMDTFVWLVLIENKDFFWYIPLSWDFSVMSERDTAWVFSKYFQFINNSNE